MIDRQLRLNSSNFFKLHPLHDFMTSPPEMVPAGFFMFHAL